MSEHPGLLGFLAEAVDIQQELGCSAEESHAIQRQRAAERKAIMDAEAESNVIPFRRKH